MEAAAEPGVVGTPASRLTRLDAGLRAHGLLIGCVSIFGGVVSLRLPRGITSDTWVSLVAGRRIIHGGLPHRDTLTYWTFGERWIDQQWLAHLLTYGLYAMGGLVLLALCQVVLLVGSVAGAAAVARRNGATARTIAWLLVGTLYPILFAGGSVRTQMFVLPLFVALLALLVRDARQPSRAVFLTLPILVLWANLHGSVAIAAGLVVLRALVGLWAREPLRRSLLLGAGAVLAVGATPYGVGIVDYYRSTLANPAFRQLVTEWGPTTPTLVNAPIFVLAGGSVWLLARHSARVGRFGVLAELALIVLSLMAIRSVIWLGLGSIVLLAPAFDAELRGVELAVGRINRMVGVVGCWFVTLMLVVTLTQGDSGLAKAYPAGAADAVAHAAAVQPGSRVFADERYADWLLFEHPELTGRLAYDARFELLSSARLQQIFDWKNQIADHRRGAAAGSTVVVLDTADGSGVEAALRRDRSMRERYSGAEIAVFTRRGQSG